jgi:hypothetical protein
LGKVTVKSIKVTVKSIRKHGAQPKIHRNSLIFLKKAVFAEYKVLI